MNNKIHVDIESFKVHSFITAATRVLSPRSTLVELTCWLPAWSRGFSPGTPAFFHIDDLLALTSVPTKAINISCITCLSNVFK